MGRGILKWGVAPVLYKGSLGSSSFSALCLSILVTPGHGKANGFIVASSIGHKAEGHFFSSASAGQEDPLVLLPVNGLMLSVHEANSIPVCRIMP